MRGYLLDTNATLFALVTPERVSDAAREAVARGPCYLSLIVYWEIVIMSMKGTLDVGDPRSWWDDSLNALRLLPLMVTPRHVTAILDLPDHHRDPFDRALVAQAITEDLVLITADTALKAYQTSGLKLLW